MRFIYSILLYLLSPLVLLRLAWLGLRNRDYWSRWAERFGFATIDTSTKPMIWIHAVSVGEVRATVSLVNRLFTEYPQYQILITTVTPTGSATVRQVFNDAVTHYYLPYDLPHAVHGFIKRIKPGILIVMETELWPNLYHYCRRYDVRILLVNARLSDHSYRGYQRFRLLTRQVLRNISLIAAQTDADGSRLVSLGADPSRVLVTGNLKFDINVPHSVTEQAQSLRRYFSVNRPVWIAASTHEGEERLVLEAHRQILKSHPDCLLIIAPRHPERFGKVAELANRSGLKTVCKSAAAACTADIQIFILDTLGELMIYYAAADLAFVGGSLLPFGGHNVLEPASLGIPVMTGKHVHNFAEINRLLLDRQAVIQVPDAEQLGQQACRLLADGNLRHNLGQLAREFVDQNRGSTDRVMDLIAENLLLQTVA